MPVTEPTNWTSHLRALAVAGVLVAVVIAGAAKTLHDPDAGPPVGEREGAGELVAEYRACQTFRAAHDRLFQIKVLLDDLGRRNRSTFLFTLHQDGPDGESLVSLAQDAYEVNSNVYHVLTFAPIEDSAGERYAFCLAAPDADLAKAITVIGTVRDTYPEGRAVFTSGMWGAGRIEDLSFHLGYDLGPWEQAGVLLDRLGAGKPAFFGAGWFYVLLIAVYLALLYLLFLYRSPDREQDPDL
jgi:hypothetical protein